MKRTNSGCKGAARLNLYQCQMLVASGMVSKCGKVDYQHEEVISRLIELQSRKDEKALAALMKHQNGAADDLPPPIPYDSYLTPAEMYDFGLTETPF